MQAPQLQVPAQDLRGSLLLYIEGMFMSSIAHSIEVSPLVQHMFL